MIIHVEKLDASSKRSTIDQLSTLIKSNIGVTAEVQLGEPGSVARSQGKAVRIVDNRGLEN
jgi:phenylacetate-CoA ligase